MGCRMTPGIAGAWLCIPHGGMAESPGPIRAAVRTRDNIYKETDIDRLVPTDTAAAPGGPARYQWVAIRSQPVLDVYDPRWTPGTA
jgi:hypothetical protein